MTTVDSSAWRDGLTAILDPAVTAVLTVQCSVGWLRPEAASLRDEIDEAITALALARPIARSDRIVLHNLPAVGALPAAEITDLNSAHADWLYRLALTGVMLPVTVRPHVHRLIVAGGQRTVDAVDGIELQLNGTWAHPDAARAVLGILCRPGATTPLTSYDVELDGPFGDTDPSIYL